LKGRSRWTGVRLLLPGRHAELHWRQENGKQSTSFLNRLAEIFEFNSNSMPFRFLLLQIVLDLMMI
jgi:hypothetical protein